MSAEKRLLELGIVLPEGPAAGGNYLSAKAVGNLLYLAGVISTGTDGVITGTAGADPSITEAYAAARACALTQLAVLKHTFGSLDKVREIVSVNGYVNAVAGFPDSPAVINGAPIFWWPSSRPGPPRARRHRRERSSPQRAG